MSIYETFKEIVRKKGLFSYIKYVFSWVRYTMNLRIHNIYWIMYSRLFNKKIIRVIGDSHVQIFIHSKRVVVHHLGPATAFNLNKENNSTKSKEKLSKLLRGFSKKDIIVLSFGEIDCRAQIYKQSVKQKLSIDFLICKTINNYFNGLSEIRAKKLPIYILSVVPAERKADISSRNIPSHIQIKIKNKFNNLLKKECKKYNFHFVDIYEETKNPQGFILKRFSNKDGVHYNLNAGSLYLSKIDLS